MFVLRWNNGERAMKIMPHQTKHGKMNNKEFIVLLKDWPTQPMYPSLRLV